MQSSPALPWLVPSRVRHSLCGSCQRRQAPLPGPSEYLTCVTTHTDTHGHACDVRRSLWHLGVTKQVAKNSMSRRGHLVFIHLLQLPLPLPLPLSLSISLKVAAAPTTRCVYAALAQAEQNIDRTQLIFGQRSVLRFYLFAQTIYNFNAYTHAGVRAYVCVCVSVN